MDDTAGAGDIAARGSSPGPGSRRTAALLRGPRGLAVLSRLNGVPNLRALVAAYGRSEVPQVVIGGAPRNVVDEPTRDVRKATNPSGSRRMPIAGDRGGEIDRALLEDPELLLETALSAISDWPWSPQAQAARPFLFLEAGNLARTAQALTGAQAARWWWDAALELPQVMLGSGTRSPDVAGGARRAAAHLDEPTWRLPWGLVTSAQVGPRITAARLCDDEGRHGLGPRIGSWRVFVASGTQVYEIGMPSDWMALCERYPRVIEPPPEWARWGVVAERGLCPDWRAVAQDWDGLHVSMSGLLTTVGLPLAVGAYGCIFEDEIGSELTLWFRAPFTELAFISEGPNVDVTAPP